MVSNVYHSAQPNSTTSAPFSTIDGDDISCDMSAVQSWQLKAIASSASGAIATVCHSCNRYCYLGRQGAELLAPNSWPWVIIQVTRILAGLRILAILAALVAPCLHDTKLAVDQSPLRKEG